MTIGRQLLLDLCCPISLLMAEEFFALFQIDRSIGASHFSRVYLATEIATGRQVALKVILKFDQENPTIQRDAMLSPLLECQHIVQAYNAYEDVNMIVIVMEYVAGGELLEWIISRGTMTEPGIAVIIHHILVGLKTLHDNGLVHRDIKPENLLVAETESGATVKISDFGLALTIDTNAQLSELCGTEVCSAPEILKGQEYGTPADIWSVGVIVYTLLSGLRPFEEDEKYPLFVKVASGGYTFDSPEWEQVSPLGKDFVKRMLQVDFSQRMTVDDALTHPWINGEVPDVPLDKSLENLKQTMMGRKLRRVMGAAKSAASFRQFTRLTQRPE